MKHFQKISAWYRTMTAGETGASLVEYSLLIALIAYSDIAQSVADN